MRKAVRYGRRLLVHTAVGGACGAGYLLYRRQSDVEELWQGQEKHTAALLRLTSSNSAEVLGRCLGLYGVAVVPERVPLRRDMGQEVCKPFANILAGITFQGRSLLTPAGGLNLDVFGAAVGSAISMPLLIPGSFLAGALVGESSGYLVSVMQSMQHPTLKALLDAACSRTWRSDKNPNDHAKHV